MKETKTMATSIETSEIVLEVEKREERGSGAAGRLRAAGLVPAVIYGGDRETVPITVED